MECLLVYMFYQCVFGFICFLSVLMSGVFGYMFYECVIWSVFWFICFLSVLMSGVFGVS